MKALFLASMVIAASPAMASEEVKPPDMSPADTWLPAQQGSLRVLNKIDSTVQLITIKVGQAMTYESLALTLSGCFVRPQDLPQDAAAHVRIEDHRAGAANFDGWILKREPALNLYQHPVYDVQLAGCG